MTKSDLFFGMACLALITGLYFMPSDTQAKPCDGTSETPIVELRPMMIDHEIIAIMLLVSVALVAFSLGQWSKENPSDEELIRRIVERRISARARKDVEAELAGEIDRRAIIAESPKP